MKILIVIDETNFYHPYFFFDLYQRLKKRKYNISVGLVTKVKKKNSIEKYLLKNLSKLYLSEILLLGIKKLFFLSTDKILVNFNIFFSVKSIINRFKIDFFEIHYDINQKKYLKKIEKIKPNLIISSCSIIFKKKILKIPKYGCINRHTALLPSYGGVYPVFQSIADGKKYSGITVHLMSNKIDQGKILAQEKILNKQNNLSKIYKEGFSKSAKLIIKGIDILLKKKKIIQYNYNKSYFSFPNNSRWIKFRKNKGRFI